MSRSPDLTRRQFLLQSAGLTLGGRAIGSEALGLRATRGDGPGTECVRLGFVGLGDRGRQLLGAALALQEVRVTALCDVHPQRLRKALDLARGRHSPRGYTDPGGLFAAGDVDAVVIATPVWLHREHTLGALARGKHVYCEKPMALHAAECREVLGACRDARARGLIYQSGFQRRYNPRYRRGLEYLHSGEPGPVRFVRAQWHAVTAPRRDKPWLHRRDRSGDIVVEQACHQFDVFNWVYRDLPVRATGMGGTHGVERAPGSDVMDHYGAVLEYPGGGKVHLSHLTYSIPERRFGGIYELVFCERTGVDLANALTWDASGRTLELCADRGNETRLAMAAFVDALIRGAVPDASAQVGHDATVAALLCRRAVESGRTVTLDEIL